MDWKLFSATFALIFLAELGDKTQLAAMASSANSETGKWTVFLAASSALVMSTLIAVLVGGALAKAVPEIYIKLVAGTLFVAFGVFIIYNALAPEKPTPAAPKEIGKLGEYVLELALEFEEAASKNYQKLASAAESPELTALLTKIGEEEDVHLSQIRQMIKEHNLAEFIASAPALPVSDELMHDVDASSDTVLTHAIEHELATEKFYEEMARVVHIPSLKPVFLALAAAEREHVNMLKNFEGQSS